MWIVLYLIPIYDFIRCLNLAACVNVADACLFDTHVRLERRPHNPDSLDLRSKKERERGDVLSAAESFLIGSSVQ